MGLAPQYITNMFSLKTHSINLRTSGTNSLLTLESILLHVACTDSLSYYGSNRNYNKILESDWSSTALIRALIGQLHTSCTCNWTVVRVMPE